ncbi:MAG TPA: hypothetical protein P5218_06625, partial [Planctomycetota bacterium]|nr:hypothetical protein [Planctomycetota bacterium]
TLVFALDDPYIHLAMVEGMLQGHYGVNPGEVCSASSSILWPILLMPFEALGLGPQGALLWNTLCGALSAALILEVLQQALPMGKYGRIRVLLGLLVLLACNAWGLAFLGMEHSLQLTLSLAIVLGLLRLGAGRPVGWWIYLASLIAPWVRYESLALASAFWLCLAWQGRWVRALGLGLGSGLVLLAYGFFLHRLGLSWIPDSARAKLEAWGVDNTPWQSIRVHWAVAWKLERGRVLMGLVVFLVILACKSGWWQPVGRAAVCLALAGLLHLSFGSYGWYNRYESAMVGGLCLGILGLGLPRVATARRPRVGIAGLALGLLLVARPYAQGQAQIALACNNIYEQQYQIHRLLLNHWRRPAAVNDLGWTSYRNDQFVLDLAGLASPEVRAMSRHSQDGAWIAVLTRQRGIELAAIYETWYPQRPAEWVQVASLSLSRRRVTPASDRVSFFATSPAAVPAVRAALQAFEPTLPKPLRLTWEDN